MFEDGLVCGCCCVVFHVCIDLFFFFFFTLVPVPTMIMVMNATTNVAPTTFRPPTLTANTTEMGNFGSDEGCMIDGVFYADGAQVTFNGFLLPFFASPISHSLQLSLVPGSF